MLTSLHIKDFAIVSELELDFENGMTAFTGETGAGKSIMIDALMLALGERADASVIRGSALSCDITASFHIDAKPNAWLKEHDVNVVDNELILRRIIHKEGRSKSYINGQPFPIQKVKELSEMLVDLHGQHQHQTLLQHATHRQQLDRYAGHEDLLNEVHRLFDDTTHIKKSLQELQSKEALGEQIALLEFQIEELSALNLKEGEIEALHEEHQLLHHAKDYLEQSQWIINILSADETPNVCRGLNQALQGLGSCPDENPLIKNATVLLQSALLQCEEALHEVHQFSSKISLDPERLKVIEERMSALHHVARKYHVDTNQLNAHLISLQEQLHALQGLETNEAELERLYAEAEQAYKKAALALRQSRQQGALKLADAITASIRQLGMPKGIVSINVTPLDKMHAHGFDKVEYLVCTNPGMSTDTLAKVVSGGELSRIGLAIHVITAERGSTPTLLFDEVDVGIGGATAALVGQLLRKLGERLQVFCVTHQPQVASSAHHHFMVEKQVKENETYSQVIQLQPTEKIDEIARMLGGLTITDQTRSHAKELLLQGVT